MILQGDTVHVTTLLLINCCSETFYMTVTTLFINVALKPTMFDEATTFHVTTLLLINVTFLSV